MINQTKNVDNKKCLQGSSPSVISTGAKSNEEQAKTYTVWLTLPTKLFAKWRNLKYAVAKHQAKFLMGVSDASIALCFVATFPNKLSMQSVKNAPVGMTNLGLLESYQIHKGGESLAVSN
ncbi:MAG: hypothetical protein ACRCYY_14835 [Trueperaceae bacterium]